MDSDLRTILEKAFGPTRRTVRENALSAFLMALAALVLVVGFVALVVF